MGFSPPISTVVTISGNVNTAGLDQPLASQAVICKCLNSCSNGATVYTVTAGKTFYCTGASVASAANAFVGVNVDGVATIVCEVLGATTALFTGGVVFTAAATKAITFYTNAGANTGFITVWGYEQ
jgi:hypothetical protein